MKITKKMCLDKDNIGQCECGNYATIDYLRFAEDGSTTCPKCMYEYLEAQVINMRDLALEIADPTLSKEDVKNMIRSKYCKIYGIDFDDTDEDFFQDIGI